MPTAEFNNPIKKNNQYFDTSEEALIVESNYFKFVKPLGEMNSVKAKINLILVGSNL